MAIQKNNTAQTVNFCFIGHFAIDSIVRFKQKRKPTLGGSVTFGSLSLKKMPQLLPTTDGQMVEFANHSQYIKLDEPMKPYTILRRVTNP